MNQRESTNSFAKSWHHFQQLLKDGKFREILQISRCYFMDIVIGRIIIAANIIGRKLHPSQKLRNCPFDGKSFPDFYPVVAGGHFVFHSRCPYCCSVERHRMQWIYFNRETDMFHPKHPITILHCAPEEAFYRKFKDIELVDYYTMDKFTGYTVCGERMRDYADLTRLPYEDDKFDYILCNHVLEHITDEQLALSELKRVLKPGGVAFINVPIDEKLTETLEDPRYNTNALRFKYYGQSDHVRKYGTDYQKHLEKAGFHVTCTVAENYFSEEEIYQYGLFSSERIYSCRK